MLTVHISRILPCSLDRSILSFVVPPAIPTFFHGVPACFNERPKARCSCTTNHGLKLKYHSAWALLENLLLRAKPHPKPNSHDSLPLVRKDFKSQYFAKILTRYIFMQCGGVKLTHITGETFGFCTGRIYFWSSNSAPSPGFLQPCAILIMDFFWHGQIMEGYANLPRQLAFGTIFPVSSLILIKNDQRIPHPFARITLPPDSISWLIAKFSCAVLTDGAI